MYGEFGYWTDNDLDVMSALNELFPGYFDTPMNSSGSEDDGYYYNFTYNYQEDSSDDDYKPFNIISDSSSNEITESNHAVSTNENSSYHLDNSETDFSDSSSFQYVDKNLLRILEIKNSIKGNKQLVSIIQSQQYRFQKDVPSYFPSIYIFFKPEEERKINNLNETVHEYVVKPLLDSINMTNKLFNTQMNNWSKSYKTISDHLDKHKNIFYILNMLNIFYEKRPKQRFCVFPILQTLIINKPAFKLHIDLFISENYDNNMMLWDFFKYKQYPTDLSHEVDVNILQYEFPLNQLYKNKIKVAIINDDFDVIQSIDNFNFNTLTFPFYEPGSYHFYHINSKLTSEYEVFFIKRPNLKNDQIFPDKMLTPIEFAAFYGSVKCFKYFLLNNAKLKPSICKFAVAGGNYEIIHILEQKNLSFEDCFRLSVEYHRYEITDWLLQSYSLDSKQFSFCAYTQNIPALLLYTLNAIETFDQKPAMIKALLSHY